MGRGNGRAKARGLGTELAALRAQSGLKLSEVADRLGMSPPTISRIENGLRATSSEEVAALLVVYKITGARGDRLVSLAKTIDQPGWWETSASGLPGQLTALIAFESEATTITDVSTILMPGLLQTAEYTRAVMAATGVRDAEIDGRVAVRLGRQGILSRPVPPRLHAIIDEAVLRRPLGGAPVMADQLRHAVAMAERRNVTVQVLRRRAHPGLNGSYVTLEFRGPALPFVHLEHFRSSLFLDEPEDVAAFAETTDTLSAMALGPARSAAYLTELADRYTAADPKTK